MATNSALRKALLETLKVTPQALSLRVQRKKKHSPMSTEDATYLIAHEEGMRIDRYLSGDQVDRVRALQTQVRPVAPAPKPPARRIHATNKTRDIRFPNNYRANDSLLSATKLSEAVQMAAVYPVLYVLENSMRELVRRVMRKNFGDTWWDTELTSGKPKTIHGKAASRMLNEKSWHQRRGAHPIDYIDLDDVGDLILAKHGNFFPDYLGNDVDFFRNFMKELTPSRNVVCHMNPLESHNIEAVKIALHRWQGMIKAAAVPPA